MYNRVLLLLRFSIWWLVPWMCLPFSSSCACPAGRLLACHVHTPLLTLSSTVSLPLATGEVLLLHHYSAYIPIPPESHVRSSFTDLATTMRVIAVLVLILYQGCQHWCRGNVPIHLPKARTTTFDSHVQHQDPCHPLEWDVVECLIEVTRTAT